MNKKWITKCFIEQNEADLYSKPITKRWQIIKVAEHSKRPIIRFARLHIDMNICMQPSERIKRSRNVRCEHSRVQDSLEVSAHYVEEA